MKKILAICLSIAMLLTFTACNKGSNTPSADATPASTEIPLTTTANITEDGNIECRVAQTFGYNDLLFTFDGEELIKVESVLKITGDDELFDSVETNLKDNPNYFDTLESDKANKSINCVYSKVGMKACSFTDKTPEELKAFLENYSSDNTLGLSAAVAGDIVGATAEP